MGLFSKFKKTEIVYDSKEIVMPVTGEAIPLETVHDEVFASGVMGQGVGILPASERVVSPSVEHSVLCFQRAMPMGLLVIMA